MLGTSSMSRPSSCSIQRPPPTSSAKLLDLQQFKYTSSMSPERWRIQESRKLFSSVGVLTGTLLAISTIFTIIDAIELRISASSYRATAIVAAILDGFTLVFIISLIGTRLYRKGGWPHRWILPLAGASLALAAAIMSLYLLVLKKSKQREVSESQQSNSSLHLDSLKVETEFAIWALTVAAEVLFYLLILLTQPSLRDRGISAPNIERPETSGRTAPVRPPTPPSPLRILTPHYALPEAAAPIPPSLTSPKEPHRTSWRDSFISLQNAVRPTSSRTRLVSARHLSWRESNTASDTRSIATTTQSDPFDTWDTSNVDLQLREALSPIVPTRGTALEPIPGSPPPSPAKALNGPFYSTSVMVMDGPPFAFIYGSRTERCERPGTTQSSHSKRVFFPAESRPTSPSGSEAHIHPLFRTDSPTPAPGATAGTVVTASPYGGQIVPSNSHAIPSRPSSRMRSDSRATASRASSPVFKQNSIDEHRTCTSPSAHPTTSTFYFEERHRSRSRSSSPIGRNMTPPIPEFILSASREMLRSTSSKETLR